MDKHIDELVWRDFEKSGHAGTYLLYKALKKQDDNSDGNGTRSKKC